MHEFIARLAEMTRKELLYIDGFLCMHRERYAEYERNLRLARARGDARRAAEMTEDLVAFRGEIAYLERQRASAVERLRTLARDEHFPATSSADGHDDAQALPNSANILRLDTR